MTFLLFISTTIALIFLMLYLSLRYQLRQLHSAVQHKKVTETNLLLTSRSKDPALQQLIDDYNQLFNELQQIKITTQQEKRTLDQAIHNITHDIRTPLTVASGYAQQLQKQAPENSSLSKINANLQTVATRLETLLEYQNLLEATIQPDFQPIDLSQLVKREALQFYDALTEKKFVVSLALTDDLMIDNDPDLAQRILQNSLGNVLKHGQKTVTIRLQKEAQHALLTVTNQTRRPIKNLAKLTTRFYSENLSETEDSAGLGLFITQQLVELTHGQLLLSETGDEFQLVIRWPLKNR